MNNQMPCVEDVLERTKGLSEDLQRLRGDILDTLTWEDVQTLSQLYVQLKELLDSQE